MVSAKKKCKAETMVTFQKETQQLSAKQRRRRIGNRLLHTNRRKIDVEEEEEEEGSRRSLRLTHVIFHVTFEIVHRAIHGNGLKKRRDRGTIEMRWQERGTNHSADVEQIGDLGLNTLSGGTPTSLVCFSLFDNLQSRSLTFTRANKVCRLELPWSFSLGRIA